MFLSAGVVDGFLLAGIVSGERNPGSDLTGLAPHLAQQVHDRWTELAALSGRDRVAALARDTRTVDQRLEDASPIGRPRRGYVRDPLLQAMLRAHADKSVDERRADEARELQTPEDLDT